MYPGHVLRPILRNNYDKLLFLFNIFSEVSNKCVKQFNQEYIIKICKNEAIGTDEQDNILKYISIFFSKFYDTKINSNVKTIFFLASFWFILFCNFELFLQLRLILDNGPFFSLTKLNCTENHIVSYSWYFIFYIWITRYPNFCFIYCFADVQLSCFWKIQTFNRHLVPLCPSVYDFTHTFNDTVTHKIDFTAYGIHEDRPQGRVGS